MKKLFWIVGIVASLVSGVFGADSTSCLKYNNNTKKCEYDGAKAASFAYNNAMDTTSPPFEDYTYVINGGNCANFVSQSILSGLVGKTDLYDVYDNRGKYAIDKNYVNLSWYFLSDSQRGSAWTSADWMYKYAQKNHDTYKGLHFVFVTEDTSKAYMDTSKVKVGDIVFGDWNDDGIMDHAMIVTSVGLGYSKIKVAYQSSSDDLKQRSRSLSSINTQYKYKATFHVYRPTFYSDYGL